MLSAVLEENTGMLLEHILTSNEKGYFVTARFNGSSQTSGVLVSEEKAKEFFDLCLKYEVLPMNIGGVYEDLMFIDNFKKK
jgi:hypothetical protein